MANFDESVVGISGVTLLFLLLIITSMPNASAREHETDTDPAGQWCIADARQSDDVLQKGIDWACGAGGADCSALQPSMPCYLPNTVKDHASYAFNDYWQKNRQQGATCSFNGAAMLTTINPSHDECKFICTA